MPSDRTAPLPAKKSPLSFAALAVLVLALAAAANAPADAPAPDPTNKTGAANLNELARTMHAYASRQTNPSWLPLAATRDKGGKPLLSWRVAILPDLVGEALYKEFKQDEAWDGEHNKKLLARMPAAYRSSLGKAAEGQTHYKVFTGPDALFGAARPTLLPKDGAVQTILIAEGGPAVPWTKPEDFAYDPKGPLPDLTPPGGGDDLFLAMVDGTVRRASRAKLTEKTLRAVITPNGMELLGPDWDAAVVEVVKPGK